MSVITQARFSPIAPCKSTSIESTIPSPTITETDEVILSADISTPPTTSFLTTVTALDNSKFPEMSATSSPILNPSIIPAQLILYTKQIPGPAGSKSNESASVIASIIPFSSVMTNLIVSPTAPIKSNCTSVSEVPRQTSSAVRPPEAVSSPPAIVSCGGAINSSLTTVIGLDKSKQPSRLDTLFPTSAPNNPSAKDKLQIWQTKSSDSSKVKGGPSGKSNILASVSVITHC